MKQTITELIDRLPDNNLAEIQATSLDEMELLKAIADLLRNTKSVRGAISAINRVIKRNENISEYLKKNVRLD